MPVVGFIPEDLFFILLSEYKFPVGCFIRKPQQIDYIEEPEIFHDLSGYIPWLFNLVFADLTEEVGRRAPSPKERNGGIGR